MPPKRKPVKYVSEQQALETEQLPNEFNPPAKQTPGLPIAHTSMADTANGPTNLYKTTPNGSYTAKMKMNTFGM
jgi:hypothetical protein